MVRLIVTFFNQRIWAFKKIKKKMHIGDSFLLTVLSHNCMLFLFSVKTKTNKKSRLLLSSNSLNNAPFHVKNSSNWGKLLCKNIVTKFITLTLLIQKLIFCASFRFALTARSQTIWKFLWYFQYTHSYAF